MHSHEVSHPQVARDGTPTDEGQARSAVGQPDGVCAQHVGPALDESLALRRLAQASISREQQEP